MAYASAADFIAAFGDTEWLQLTDRDLDGISDAGVGDDAFRQASEAIDGFAKGIYAIPLNPINKDIKRMTIAIARWYLSGNEASHRCEKEYEYVLDRLKDVEAGRFSLVSSLKSSSSSDGTTGSSGGLAYSTPSDGFTAAPGITSYL